MLRLPDFKFKLIISICFRKYLNQLHSPFEYGLGHIADNFLN
jgi:hypothetical protein